MAGYAVKFDGANNSIDFGNILLTNTVVSVCAVIQLPTNGSSNFDIVFGYGNTRWFLIIEGATTTLGFNKKTSGAEVSSGATASLAFGVPYFVCGTYDPSGGANNLTISVYTLNGILFSSASSTQTGALDSTAVNLQAGHDPSRGFFTSETVQYLKVYSRIISTAEKVALANGEVIDSTNLIGQWDCQEGTGTTTTDSSGSGNTGTLSGSPLPTWVSGLRNMAKFKNSNLRPRAFAPGLAR